MRILAIADITERLLYDDFAPERWRSRVDLVLCCGDLDQEYLEFLIGRALAAPPNGARKTGKVAHIVAGTYTRSRRGRTGPPRGAHGRHPRRRRR